MKKIILIITSFLIIGVYYTPNIEIKATFATRSPQEPTTLFELSVNPGIHSQPFDLNVQIPSIPEAVIYFTIDGTEPVSGEDRFIEREGNDILVAGEIDASGYIAVIDRSGNWRDSLLTSLSERWGTVVPAEGAETLRGTSFRFRGFVDGEPVTDTFTATYIIDEDFATRFANTPVMSVTAPMDEFIYIYDHADRFDTTTRRRIFNFEYFENGDNGFERKFSLPGSTSLGGSGTRAYPQRTLNVHLARGELNGAITHPIFEGNNDVRRFRLWNGGNSFWWNHMRDPFAQKASSELNVPYAESNLVIKFVNGEFWGFSTMREHTNNNDFAETRLDMERGNVAILSASLRFLSPNPYHFEYYFDVDEGNETIALTLFSELVTFVSNNDLSLDENRRILFEKYFCEDNFIDYLIANTFFNNIDWPHNNIRLFRAINPDESSDNPNNDGRWRFILHDMDYTVSLQNRPNDTRFWNLLNKVRYADDFNYIFYVFNNRAFVEKFRERALYVLETDFDLVRLLNLHESFLDRYVPLLEEMYNRFPTHGSVAASIANFNRHKNHVIYFLTHRHEHYINQLNNLIERLGPTQLETPRNLSVVDGILTWTAAHNNFEIFIDGASVGTSKTNSFILNLKQVGIFSITVVALSNHSNIADSEISKAYDYSIVQVEAPTGLAVANGVLSWISVHNNFEIFINGISVGTSKTNYFTLNLNSTGEYSIVVVAIGNDTDILTSEPSVIYIYQIVQHDAPTNLTVSNKILTWTSSHDNFEIFINGISVGISATTSFALNLTLVGEYEITVVALGNDTDLLNSESSEIYIYRIVQLDSPTGLTVTNGVLTWISSHNNFEIFVNGASVGISSSNSFTLDLTNVGVYLLTVVALGNNVDVLDSEESIVYEYTIVRLNAPTNLSVENRILTWNSTHDNFEIFINGVSVGTSTTNSFELDINEAGEYEITIIALGNNINVLNSSPSPIYFYAIPEALNITAMIIIISSALLVSIAGIFFILKRRKIF
ncbi:MAG: CotH kinase family protein [Erysipelotrichales bacterium]|nr:CotH kinase family protein [Erysipelotrichales bacterium]